MRQAALARRARQAGLDRLDDARRPVAGDQQGIAQAAGAHVLKEGRDRLPVLLRARHQVQQHLAPLGGEAPGGQDRLPALPGTQPLGDAVDEEIGDVVLAEIPLDEVLVVRPQPLAQLRDRRARQQQAAPLVPEGLLDVAHRKPARQKLHRQVLQLLAMAFEVIGDHRAPGLVTPGNLRNRVLDHALSRLEPRRAAAVAIAPARRRAVLVIVPAQNFALLRLQGLLRDQLGGQPDQLAARIGRHQPTLDQLTQGFTGPFGCWYSPFHGVPPLIEPGPAQVRLENAHLKGCTPAEFSSNFRTSPHVGGQ